MESGRDPYRRKKKERQKERNAMIELELYVGMTYIIIIIL